MAVLHRVSSLRFFRDPRGTTVWALVYFCLLTILLTYPILPNIAHGTTNTGDPLLNTWILDWDTHALTTRPLDLYQANIFFPYPSTLAYSESLLGSVPLAGPIILLTHNPLLATNVLTLIGFAVSGWGMYLLVTRLTGKPLAGLVAGSAFAFSPFRFVHVSHLQLVTVQWMPFIFLFLDRLFAERRWRDWLALLVVLNLQFLSSYYNGLFVVLAFGILLLGYLVLQWRSLSRHLVAQIAALGGVTLAINLPLAWPYFQVSHAMGFVRSLDEVVTGSARLVNYLSAGPGNLLYDHLTLPLREQAWSEHSLMLGLATWGLALIGLATLKRSGSKRWIACVYALLVLVAIVLSFGPQLQMADGTTLWLPYRLLYDLVPGFASIRVPARTAIVVLLGLAVLAGFGVAQILERVRSNKRRGWLTGLACAAIILEAASVPIPFQTMPVGDAIPAVYRWLAARPGNEVVFELPVPYPWSTIGYVEGPRLYYATVHRKPLVNGYSGFFPPVYEQLVKLSQNFPRADLVSWLKGLRVNLLILHRDQYSADAWTKIVTAMNQYQDSFDSLGWYGDAWVLQVRLPEWQLDSTSERPTFGRHIRLLGYEMTGTAKSGRLLGVRLYWQAVGTQNSAATVFVHLLDSNGKLAAQHDGPPQNGRRLTSTWRDGEVIVDEHQILLPADLAPGEYQLQVGMYQPETIERLSISDSTNSTLGDALRLAHVFITP